MNTLIKASLFMTILGLGTLPTFAVEETEPLPVFMARPLEARRAFATERVSSRRKDFPDLTTDDLLGCFDMLSRMSDFRSSPIDQAEVLCIYKVVTSASLPLTGLCAQFSSWKGSAISRTGEVTWDVTVDFDAKTYSAQARDRSYRASGTVEISRCERNSLVFEIKGTGDGSDGPCTLRDTGAGYCSRSEKIGSRLFSGDFKPK